MGLRIYLFHIENYYCQCPFLNFGCRKLTEKIPRLIGRFRKFVLLCFSNVRVKCFSFYIIMYYTHTYIQKCKMKPELNQNCACK